MLGQNNATFNWRARVARKCDINRHLMCSGGEFECGFAVGESPLRDDIAANASVEGVTGGVERGVDLDHGGKVAILDDDRLECVLSQVTRLGNYDGNRFAGVAHPINRKWPMLHRLFDTHHKGLRPALDIIARQNSSDSRHRHRSRGIDRENFGVRTGRSQNRCVQHSGFTA